MLCRDTVQGECELYAYATLTERSCFVRGNFDGLIDPITESRHDGQLRCYTYGTNRQRPTILVLLPILNPRSVRGLLMAPYPAKWSLLPVGLTFRLVLRSRADGLLGSYTTPSSYQPSGELRCAFRTPYRES